MNKIVFLINFKDIAGARGIKLEYLLFAVKNNSHNLPPKKITVIFSDDGKIIT